MKTKIKMASHEKNICGYTIGSREENGEQAINVVGK